jgi:hypothetical protein
MSVEVHGQLTSQQTSRGASTLSQGQCSRPSACVLPLSVSLWQPSEACGRESVSHGLAPRSALLATHGPHLTERLQRRALQGSVANRPGFSWLKRLQVGCHFDATSRLVPHPHRGTRCPCALFASVHSVPLVRSGHVFKRATCRWPACLWPWLHVVCDKISSKFPWKCWPLPVGAEANQTVWLLST